MFTKSNNLFYLLLVLIGAILGYLGWCDMPCTPFIFIFFVPLLLINYQLNTKTTSKANLKFAAFAYLFFLIWNVLTTWWVINSSGAAIVAFSLNSLFMTLPFIFFRKVYHKWGSNVAYVSLIAFWLSFEYLHQIWELTWPWLTLGNAFATKPDWVQWYEFTGNSGGSLWVLVVNVLCSVYAIQIINYRWKNKNYSSPFFLLQNKLMWVIIGVVSLPIGISTAMYYNYTDQGSPIEVVAVQPNIDPWNEKFDSGSEKKQLEKMLDLAQPLITPTTKYVALPETALPSGVWINDFEENKRVQQLRAFIVQNPNISVVTGVTMLQHYDTKNATATARNYKGGANESYDVYNAAVQLDTSGRLQKYYKSKLVPGSERMPYPQLFKFLAPFALNLGGIIGSNGTQAERTVFFNPDSIGVAPVICYESIFSEYVTEYIRKGANLIFIITNDGWWGNTAGHIQHLHYARLRAIETRRSIARSANTGISCFINQRGDLFQQQKWWTASAIKQTINANTLLTFYVKFGDIISKLAMFIALICAALMFFPYKNK